MDLINNNVYDSLHDLLDELEELIDYKKYISSELESSNNLSTINYYTKELDKVNGKLNEVIINVDLLKGKLDLFKSQRADIIDKSINNGRPKR